MLPVTVFRIIILEEPVQERGVRRIDSHFKRLQPVGLDQPLEGKAVRLRRSKTIERRQSGRFTGPQIGKDDAVARDTGINHEMRIKITALHDETGEEFEASSGWREDDQTGTSLMLEEPGPYTITVSSSSIARPMRRRIGWK